MQRIPTDIQILHAIYERYYQTFSEFVSKDGDRLTKIYVPIDIDAIARELKIDGDIIFGQLYYHLDNKYRFRNPDDSIVHFFALQIQEGSRCDRHCIHFPLMASVLADLRDEQRRYRTVTWISFAALVISAISTAISILALRTTLLS